MFWCYLLNREYKDLFLSPSAASCKASDRVGWACMVLARSSLLAENSIANTASATSSEACEPMMWTPNSASDDNSRWFKFNYFMNVFTGNSSRNIDW